MEKLKDAEVIDIEPIATTSAIVPAAPVQMQKPDPELINIANECLALSPNPSPGKAQYLANLVKKGDRTSLTNLHHQLTVSITNSHNTTTTTNTVTHNQPIYIDARRYYQVHGGGGGARDVNVHLFNGRRDDEGDRTSTHHTHFHGSLLMVAVAMMVGFLAIAWMNGLSSQLDRSIAGDRSPSQGGIQNADYQ